MLKVQRVANGLVVFTVSGRMTADSIADLETLFRSDAKCRPIVLDLKDLTLVNQDAVGFLERCEANDITLQNCPAYVREWIKRHREGNQA